MYFIMHQDLAGFWIIGCDDTRSPIRRQRTFRVHELPLLGGKIERPCALRPITWITGKLASEDKHTIDVGHVGKAVIRMTRVWLFALSDCFVTHLRVCCWQ